MKKINAQIVADSVNPQGNRITTFLLTYPRFIHGELMTHRMFSRNSASSRAIPFEKMVKMVEEDPFIPIAWQKDHKGMQGTEYITSKGEIELRTNQWLNASKYALKAAKELNSNCQSSQYDSEIENSGVTKQLCNRLLELFMWHTVLVTVTEWNNFFELRCPKYQWQDGKVFNSWKDLVADAFNNGANRDWVDGLENCPLIERLNHSKSQAEIHIQVLAEAIWDAMNESIPNQLEAGEWHIPFGDTFDKWKLFDAVCNTTQVFRSTENKEVELGKLKVATARCARLSYMTFDGEIDYEKDIKLHDKLLVDGHMSPFEHCARAMSDKEYYSFVKGTIPTQIDEYGITNLEMMPVSSGHPIVGFTGLNPTNGDKYGWCNNFRGFIQYRYLIENENWIIR